MAYKSVRNRLGRALITWLGIVLGITFLMSTLVSSEIRSSIHILAEQRTTIQSMVGTLRAEVGDLRGKKIVILTAEPIADRQLLDALTDWLARNVSQLQVSGPLTGQFDVAQQLYDASAVILWQVPDAPQSYADWDRALGKMKQRLVLTYGPSPALTDTPQSKIRLGRLLPEPIDPEQLTAQKDLSASRTAWLTIVSLLVAAIGISNALLMSVTERYREIGTMKCLGALDSFIIRIILLESSFLGLTGAIIGVGLGTLFAVLGYAGTYGFDVAAGAIDSRYVLMTGGLCLLLGWGIAVVAAIYPSHVAARMVPADALRTEV